MTRYLLLCLLVAAVGLGQTAEPAIRITHDGEGWHIRGESLDALVAPDGCLTLLRFPAPGEHWAHIPNYVKTGTGLPDEGPGGSRGAFFFQDQVVPLPEIRADGDAVVVAAGPAAAVRYAFTPGAMEWQLANKTERPMLYLIVLDPTVQAVVDSRGAVRPTPTTALWTEITCYQDKRRLHIRGLDRIWGPGELIGQNWRQGQFQVLEVTLAPHARRTLSFALDFASANDVATVEGLAPKVPSRGSAPTQMLAPTPAVGGPLTVYSPRDYQVFQRRTRDRGELFLSGRATVAGDVLEYRRLDGSGDGPWQPLPLDPALRSFNVRVPAPAGGWYRLDFRLRTGDQVAATATVDHVGVGEVFVGCGQSNSTNCGSEPQQTVSRMVSSFDGTNWQIADDPQLGTHDHYRFGSFWPAFGDAMHARYGVPIGVAVTGQGGAPVSNWRPGKPAFVWLMLRIAQLGPNGCRGLLWHQGESDIGNTADYYYDALSTTIAASHAAAGWYFPWFVAKVSYHNPRDASFPTTREAQQRLWDNGIALPGPDTDTLVGDYRAGIHFNAKGLKRHGEMWAEQVALYLDPVLAGE